jgi:hypothetical protein
MVRKKSWKFRALFGALLASTSVACAQVYLTADGVTPAYTRIQGVLHASPENPDCAHPIFGPHITQVPDSDLGSYVFDFNIHVIPDNDRCSKFDRERLEIKTEGNSSTPDYLKGFLGDTVTFRWRFKLPEGFQPSYSFTHIHQIKAYDGDDGSPLLTLTPRYSSSGNTLQLIHIDSKGTTTYLASTALSPFLGTWVEAYEKIKYGTTGQYSIVIRRVSDGATLFSYSSSNLDLWRNGTTVVRPKWGIYRSLNNAQQLRDEQVLFDDFCLAKGTDDCLSSEQLPDFTVTASGGSTTVAQGGAAVYAVNLTALRSFNQSVSLSLTGSNAVPGSTGPQPASNLTGLPAAATASFSPATIPGGSGLSTLTIMTSRRTPPGHYTLVISGISADGIRSHVATVPLVVQGTPGDVNGNGLVDCGDLALIRLSLGSKVGEWRYLPRTDFNGDGTVDVQDLAFAAQRISSGMTCRGVSKGEMQ